MSKWALQRIQDKLAVERDCRHKAEESAMTPLQSVTKPRSMPTRKRPRAMHEHSLRRERPPDKPPNPQCPRCKGKSFCYLKEWAKPCKYRYR